MAILLSTVESASRVDLVLANNVASAATKSPPLTDTVVSASKIATAAPANMVAGVAVADATFSASAEKVEDTISDCSSIVIDETVVVSAIPNSRAELSALASMSPKNGVDAQSFFHESEERLPSGSRSSRITLFSTDASISMSPAWICAFLSATVAREISLL